MERTPLNEAPLIPRRRVPIEKARFELIPKLLATHKMADPDVDDIHALYEDCHALIFDSKPADGLKKWPDAESKLTELADELDCSLRVLICSVMIAHRETARYRPFYSNMLMGKSAARRVNMYRDVCLKEFGFFDVHNLTLLTGGIKTTLEERMYASELAFGRFIVGYKLKRGDDAAPAFYLMNELNQDPRWLAIEPSYQDVILAPHLKSKSTTEEFQRHVQDAGQTVRPSSVTKETLRQRQSVCKTIGDLKRHKSKAVFIFKSRIDAVQKVLPMIVVQFGLELHQLEIEDKPVTDMYRFWAKLGVAIQHHHLFNYVQGDRRAIRKLYTPRLP